MSALCSYLCFPCNFGNRTTKYSVYSPETYEGHWKQLTVRTTRTKRAMAIIFFNPQVSWCIQARGREIHSVFTSSPSMFTVRNLRKRSSTPWGAPWRPISSKEKVKRAALPLCTLFERVRGEYNQHLIKNGPQKHPDNNQTFLALKNVSKPRGPAMWACGWRELHLRGAARFEVQDIPSLLLSGNQEKQHRRFSTSKCFLIGFSLRR